MSAAAMTPAMAAADLMDQLRQLLGRHDGAADLDQVEEFANELTAVLRRTRGRIARLKKAAAPKPVDEPKPAAPEKAQAVARPRGTPARTPARPAPIRITTAPARTRPKPTPFRISAVAVAVAAAAVLWSDARTGTGRRARRVVSAARTAGRAVAHWFAGDCRRDDEQSAHRECLVCGPDCVSPITRETRLGRLAGRLARRLRIPDDAAQR